MIEAILNGSPGLVPAFAVLALLLGLAAHRLARRYGWPQVFTVLFGVALAAELTATFYPTGQGGSTRPVCAVSSDLAFVFDTEQGRMNILMFVPIGLFAVLAFGRPLAVAVGAAGLSALTETGQGLLPGVGRACDSSDFAANAVGGLAGVLLGCAVRLALRRRIRPGLREWKLSGTLAAGVAVPVLLLQAFVFSPTAPGGVVEATAEQRELARRDAELLLGPGVEVVKVQREVGDGYPDQLAVMTRTGGSFNVEWPSGRLRYVFGSTGVPGPGGWPPVTISEQDARAVADRFARQWLVGRGADTEPRLAPRGGQEGSHRFTYGTGAAALVVDVGDGGRVVWFGEG
ncbi:VanZ family protein [Kitasatospora sp. NPDC001540]|uniref:VanZ family protein n=1 Tax=Kitasatospora sp. NPDC001540 TaxID=3364014 RepID=UPI0036B4B932